jgi:hypothetical protein
MTFPKGTSRAPKISKKFIKRIIFQVHFTGTLRALKKNNFYKKNRRLGKYLSK